MSHTPTDYSRAEANQEHDDSHYTELRLTSRDVGMKYNSSNNNLNELTQLINPSLSPNPLTSPTKSQKSQKLRVNSSDIVSNELDDGFNDDNDDDDGDDYNDDDDNEDDDDGSFTADMLDTTFDNQLNLHNQSEIEFLAKSATFNTNNDVNNQKNTNNQQNSSLTHSFTHSPQITQQSSHSSNPSLVTASYNSNYTALPQQNGHFNSNLDDISPAQHPINYSQHQNGTLIDPIPSPINTAHQAVMSLHGIQSKAIVDPNMAPVQNRFTGSPFHRRENFPLDDADSNGNNINRDQTQGGIQYNLNQHQMSILSRHNINNINQNGQNIQNIGQNGPNNTALLPNGHLNHIPIGFSTVPPTYTSPDMEINDNLNHYAPIQNGILPALNLQEQQQQLQQPLVQNAFVPPILPNLVTNPSNLRQNNHNHNIDNHSHEYLHRATEKHSAVQLILQQKNENLNLNVVANTSQQPKTAIEVAIDEVQAGVEAMKMGIPKPIPTFTRAHFNTNWITDRYDLQSSHRRTTRSNTSLHSHRLIDDTDSYITNTFSSPTQARPEFDDTFDVEKNLVSQQFINCLKLRREFLYTPAYVDRRNFDVLERPAPYEPDLDGKTVTRTGFAALTTTETTSSVVSAFVSGGDKCNEQCSGVNNNKSRGSNGGDRNNSNNNSNNNNNMNLSQTPGIYVSPTQMTPSQAQTGLQYQSGIVAAPVGDGTATAVASNVIGANEENNSKNQEKNNFKNQEKNNSQNDNLPTTPITAHSQLTTTSNQSDHEPRPSFTSSISSLAASIASPRANTPGHNFYSHNHTRQPSSHSHQTPNSNQQPQPLPIAPLSNQRSASPIEHVHRQPTKLITTTTVTLDPSVFDHIDQSLSAELINQPENFMYGFVNGVMHVYRRDGADLVEYGRTLQQLKREKRQATNPSINLLREDPNASLTQLRRRRRLAYDDEKARIREEKMFNKGVEHQKKFEGYIHDVYHLAIHQHHVCVNNNAVASDVVPGMPLDVNRTDYLRFLAQINPTMSPNNNPTPFSPDFNGDNTVNNSTSDGNKDNNKENTKNDNNNNISNAKVTLNDLSSANLTAKDSQGNEFTISQSDLMRINRYYDQFDNIIKVPSWVDFCDALVYILQIAANGPCKSWAYHRLTMLDTQKNLHTQLNQDLERAQSKAVPHRDFYNVRKIDNHVHHSACMNQKHLLRFIKRKLREPEAVSYPVITRDGHDLTLEQVFKSLKLTAYDLSIDTLDMHASQTFHRFDKFNAKYSPIQETRLREIFLKYNNKIKGQYLAEITREVFEDLHANKYQFAEYRVSIYGKDITEWDALADWIVDFKLISPNVRWMIQVPRLYKIYKKSGSIDTFQDMLTNIFLPIFHCTLFPQSNPKLHQLLSLIVGFDTVDDESVRTRFFDKTNQPPPQKWEIEEDPHYCVFLYYLYANLRALNHLREMVGMNTFALRPHAGEAGDEANVAAAFLTSRGINHGLTLHRTPPIQYLYYLAQVGISMSPLSNNLLFLEYQKNPFPKFFNRGLNVTLSTDDPLMIHVTKEPLIEEYSIASQVWGLSHLDLCEIAKNSVLQSGFEHQYKVHWLGNSYYKHAGTEANDIRSSNLPDIRAQYRWEVLYREHLLLTTYAYHHNKVDVDLIDPQY